MSRIACVYLPALPLQAVLRLEPELDPTQRIIVTASAHPRAPVLAASLAAREAGIRTGMTAAQAAGAAADLVARVCSEAALRSTSDALVDVARAFAARVQRTASDLVYLEVGDLRRLFPRETSLAAALDAATHKVGLMVRIGIAGAKATARIAARQSEDGAVTLVPSAQERRFLADLPVALAEPSPELAASLTRFGLRTLGSVAALPGAVLGRRLGREGAALWRLARGEDDDTLRPDPDPEQYLEAVDLDYPLETSEPLSFVLRGALSRLCARMETRGVACAGLALTLRLTPRGRDARDVVVAAPTTDAAVLVTLVRLSLEERPPPGAVGGFEVAATPGALEHRQLPLFGPVVPAPGRLAATIARLTALCGAERVGTPTIVDSHLPEADALVAFAPPAAPVLTTPPAPPPRVVALRRVLPPRAARVAIAHAAPVTLDDEPLRRVSGPWRVGGQWWCEDVFSRDYYDLEAGTGVVYRVYHDRGAGRWFIDGVYD